jgi:hypothetical protein
MAAKRAATTEPKKTGRPTSYTEELGALICERIATTARGLDFICTRDEELPSSRTVHRWLNENEAFRQSYLRAREAQADLLFDECLEIADDTSSDTIIREYENGSVSEQPNSEWISRSKLRVDTRMRMAGKLAPKKYGDSVQLKHADADGERLPPDETQISARMAALLALAGHRKAADEGE